MLAVKKNRDFLGGFLNTMINSLKKQVKLNFFLLNWRFSAAQWLEAICANNPVFCAKHPPFEFAFSPSAAAPSRGIENRNKNRKL